MADSAEATRARWPGPFNGKARFQMQFAVDADNATIQEAVLNDERSQKYISGKQVMKVIIVPKKIVNVVIK